MQGPTAAPWYLHYPVLGLQARPLGGGVLVHGADVLARPRPLAVQVEAIAVGASADHAEARSQFGFHLLGETSGQRERWLAATEPSWKEGKKQTNYLNHGCLVGEHEGHEDDGELQRVVNLEYEAEAEHAADCCMLCVCRALFLGKSVNRSPRRAST